MTRAEARKLASQMIHMLAPSRPVRKALPKKRRRATTPQPSAPDVMRAAVRAVPEPTASASLAEAFDAAKAKYDDDPRYGTPLAFAPRGVTKNSTGRTFADVVADATRKAR